MNQMFIICTFSKYFIDKCIVFKFIACSQRITVSSELLIFTKFVKVDASFISMKSAQYLKLTNLSVCRQCGFDIYFVFITVKYHYLI